MAPRLPDYVTIKSDGTLAAKILMHQLCSRALFASTAHSGFIDGTLLLLLDSTAFVATPGPLTHRRRLSDAF